jgi:protein arginine N-methyltransferase 1
MYGVYEYCSMVEDRRRVAAYRRALERTVTPDSVVLDVGTGIGLFAIVAAKLGARHVYGLEHSELVELGPELAKAAGVSDRVTFVRGSALDVEPKEKANVIFYDMRGNTPLFHDNFSVVSHVKRRWLAPGGTMFPARDRLRVAVATASALTRERQNRLDAVREMGVPTAAIERVIANTAISDRQDPIGADEVLTHAATWATVEYGDPPPRSVSGRAKLSAVQAGLARGLCVWFESELVPGVTYENGPGHISPYASQLLPFESEVALAPGDSVEVSLDAFTDGSQWGWTHAVTRTSGEAIPEKRQSTLLAQVRSVQDILRDSPASKPVLNADGRRRLEMLGAFDGNATLADLSRRFARDETDHAVRRALVELRELAQRYSR